jgi:hypothetical protein
MKVSLHQRRAAMFLSGKRGPTLMLEIILNFILILVGIALAQWLFEYPASGLTTRPPVESAESSGGTWAP